jgi:hypothetical protein
VVAGESNSHTIITGAHTIESVDNTPTMYPRPTPISGTPASTAIPGTVLLAGLSVDPKRRAEYYHTHGVAGGWPDVPLGSRSTGGGTGNLGFGRNSPASFPSMSPGSAATSPTLGLTPDEAAAAQLTPSEVREEREHERTRRRLALRKKAERARSSRAGGGTGSGSSLPGSPAPELISGGGVTPRMSLPSGNDFLHVHPSMQHAAQFGMQSSRLGRGGSGAMSSRFDASVSSASLAASPQSARAAFPHSLSSPGGLESIRRSLSDGTQNIDHHFASSSVSPNPRNTGGDQHRIDMPSEPDDDSTLLERVNAGFWSRVKRWDSVQRQKALRWCANINAVLGLAYFIVCLSVLSTSFSNPSLHWSTASVSLFTIYMGIHLRIVAKRMDLLLMLLYLILGGIQVGGMIILSILLFHANRVAMDFNMRTEWNTEMDLEQRQQQWNERFEEFRDQCVFHLKILGATTITVLCFIVRFTQDIRRNSH